MLGISYMQMKWYLINAIAVGIISFFTFYYFIIKAIFRVFYNIQQNAPVKILFAYLFFILHFGYLFFSLSECLLASLSFMAFSFSNTDGWMIVFGFDNSQDAFVVFFNLILVKYRLHSNIPLYFL